MSGGETAGNPRGAPSGGPLEILEADFGRELSASGS